MKYTMWIKQDKATFLTIRNLLINSGFTTDSLNIITGERKPIPDDFPIEKIIFMDNNIIFISDYCDELSPNQEVIKKLLEHKEGFDCTIMIR